MLTRGRAAEEFTRRFRSRRLTNSPRGLLPALATAIEITFFFYLFNERIR